MGCFAYIKLYLETLSKTSRAVKICINFGYCFGLFPTDVSFDEYNYENKFRINTLKATFQFLSFPFHTFVSAGKKIYQNNVQQEISVLL